MRESAPPLEYFIRFPAQEIYRFSSGEFSFKIEIYAFLNVTGVSGTSKLSRRIVV